MCDIAARANRVNRLTCDYYSTFACASAVLWNDVACLPNCMLDEIIKTSAWALLLLSTLPAMCTFIDCIMNVFAIDSSIVS